MKIVFDISLTDAFQVLHCLELGETVLELSHGSRIGIRAMRQQLSDAIKVETKLDSSIGDTGTIGFQVIRKVYLQGDDS